MATEFYDEEQAKKVYELEETMVLDDETSYFLVSCEELTRKTNLLSLAKALNGDESSENKEYKFYSTSYLDNKVKEIYQVINEMDGTFDDYTNTIEKLKTKIDTSIENFNKIINSLDPKITQIQNDLQDYIDKKCSALSQEDTKIYARIDEIYQELTQSDTDIRKYINDQFKKLFEVIDAGGDV